ncbi:GTP-binding protein [Thiohalocapsa sp. ML1]|uniref:CobW family GTP-binding protein n=1 Tax=Thiohalocapsa sp. ML1 TaxID=1431688 RepID=UPI000732061A|nr:GTP-binding protein [Thiohalocapsa sp. ML1]
MPTPLIPVTLLTGFLGSGKTTVLNHLVRQPELARTLVIINELGEIGLDHLLLTRIADDSVVEMSSGCLCCTIRGDLIGTLKDAHWRFSRGGERQFDRVVIETTGLADPAPLDAQPAALKQAAMADCLLLTKADLAEPAAVAALEARLQGINPAARRLRFEHCVVAASALLGLGLFDADSKIPDVARWLNEEAYPGGADPGAIDACGTHHYDNHVHDDHAEHRHAHHAHDPNRHDDRIRAFCLVIDEPLAESMLDAWLDLLLSMSGPDLLRVKGILNLRERAAPVAIHGVQHIFHPPVELPAWPDADRRSKIVCITRDIPRATIEASLAEFIEVWRRP